MKKFWGTFTVLIISIICATFFYQSQNKASAKMNTVKIGILRVPNDVAAARETAELQKALKKSGLKVKFITFDSGVDANKALLSNDIQLATMGHTNAVVAMAAGIPCNLVWVNDIIGSNEQFVLSDKAKFHNWSDLVGKKIATPFASTSHYSIMMLLTKHGLLGKVDLLDMQTTEIVAAWNQGNIDGAYTWEPSLSNLKNARTITDSSELAEAGALTANVTLATKNFQDDYPDVLRNILKVLNHEHSLLKDQPTAIYKLTGKQLGISPKETKKQIGTSSWLTDTQQRKFMNHKFVNQFFQTAEFMWGQQTLVTKPSERQCQHFISTKFIE